MNHLFRELAPVSAAAWDAIGNEAGRTLRTMLAGRKLVDFRGPLGWDAASVSTGRSEPATPPRAGSHWPKTARSFTATGRRDLRHRRGAGRRTARAIG